MICLRSLFALASIGLAHAAVLPRQAISTLSSTAIDAFAPYTYFASTAYCDPSTTINWSCGTNCDANPDFQPAISGGGGIEQFYYVGYSPTLSSAIVAYEGTASLFGDLTDLNFFLEPLDPSLFPGIPSTVEVHSGFADQHALTARTILTTVQQVLNAQGENTVTVVGHSLGAALALLNGVFLRLQLPASIKVNVIGYGMPRVGNQDFANFVDSLGGIVTHVNNQEDPVPVVPPTWLGFHHPSGEIHIQDSGDWDVCPGQDNPSNLCIAGDVTDILNGNLINHLGPYAGISIGC
ncbi:lipase [Russula earlei]|uniref:Lipase n=1 Tax=Russula earlei TaxID=71964 RepID=A0ACC0UFM8_9AGAM|nr:lipase [Russula earlei]